MLKKVIPHIIVMVSYNQVQGHPKYPKAETKAMPLSSIETKLQQGQGQV